MPSRVGWATSKSKLQLKPSTDLCGRTVPRNGLGEELNIVLRRSVFIDLSSSGLEPEALNRSKIQVRHKRDGRRTDPEFDLDLSSW